MRTIHLLHLGLHSSAYQRLVDYTCSDPLPSFPEMPVAQQGRLSCVLLYSQRFLWWCSKGLQLPSCVVIVFGLLEVHLAKRMLGIVVPAHRERVSRCWGVSSGGYISIWRGRWATFGCWLLFLTRVFYYRRRPRYM